MATNSADPRKEADKLYTDRQSQQWRQPLNANRDQRVGRQGRITPQDALIADPRNGIGAIRVGDRTPEQAYKAAKQDGRNDRNDGRSNSYRETHRPEGTPWPAGWSTSKAEALEAELLRIAAEKKGEKPRADRRDAFDFSTADVWEQVGGWVVAVSDGQMVRWRKNQAPQEVLDRLLQG